MLFRLPGVGQGVGGGLFTCGKVDLVGVGGTMKDAVLLTSPKVRALPCHVNFSAE